MLKSKSGRFKIIAEIEGISFLVLLLIAMPLKYFWGMPWMVQKVGMLHGVFFILYIFAAIDVKKLLNWSQKDFLFALFLSFVPFGTFYVVRKMMG